VHPPFPILNIDTIALVVLIKGEIMISIRDIPFNINSDQLSETLHIELGTKLSKKFQELVSMVQEIGKPKALYKVSFIDNKDSDSVTIDDVTFTSLALRKNLDSVNRVFPYIATCGTEVDEIVTENGDLEKKVWLYYIKLNLLQTSIQYLIEQIKRRYKVSDLSTMNPGSGDASVWPIEQLKDLFSMFTNVESLTGVRLTESLVMVPDMSVTGILFTSETSFQSCQLCHRANCPIRRAPFSKELWESINQDSS
jgi:uncharacterized protein YfkK (UPF0435 family)